MIVYMVWAEHANGGGVIGIYKDKREANVVAELHQEDADMEGNVVEYFVEDYLVI